MLLGMIWKFNILRNWQRAKCFQSYKQQVKKSLTNDAQASNIILNLAGLLQSELSLDT